MNDTTQRIDTNLGELIAFFYQQFLEAYGDPELASVAAAAVINDMLAGDGAADEAAAALPRVA